MFMPIIRITSETYFQLLLWFGFNVMLTRSSQQKVNCQDKYRELLLVRYRFYYLTPMDSTRICCLHTIEQHTLEEPKGHFQVI